MLGIIILVVLFALLLIASSGENDKLIGILFLSFFGFATFSLVIGINDPYDYTVVKYEANIEELPTGRYIYIYRARF